jgi:hypothetical protein
MASHQEGYFGKPKGGIEANFDNLCLAVLAEEELLVRIREFPKSTLGQLRTPADAVGSNG